MEPIATCSMCVAAPALAFLEKQHMGLGAEGFIVRGGSGAFR
jgi:hypothetical protein